MVEAIVVSVPAVIAAVASIKVARIVSGNGRGNVTKMVEELVDWKEDHQTEHQAFSVLLVQAMRRD